MEFNYTNTISSLLLKNKKNVEKISENVNEDTSFSKEDAENKWEETLNSVKKFIADTGHDIGVFANKALDTAKLTAEEIVDAAEDLMNIIKTDFNENSQDKIAAGIDWVDDATSDLADILDSASSTLTDAASEYISQIPSDSALGTVIKGIASSMTQAAGGYDDGISETEFGSIMQNSWDTFLKDFSKSTGNSAKINFLKTTPLDSGSKRDALFGNMVLGCPFLFNNMADPKNRTYIDSMVKDGKILSLTPGMPMYNGGQFTQSKSNNIYNQTTTSTQMLSYLLKNGLDKSFSEKDKRYYSFRATYGEYFSYLETMLNTIWVKLGLGTGEEDNNFNLMTFFKIKDGNGISADGQHTLLEQYEHSIGFYVNPASAVSESIDSQQTSFGSDLAGDVNTAASQYQRLLYLTGMGTGNSKRNLVKKTGMATLVASQMGNLLAETFQNAKSLSASGWGVGKETGSVALGVTLGAAGLAAGAAMDITKFNWSQDLSSVIQQFQSTNGMQVVYPELWANTGYSKNINFNFSFISPYGDPMSIFKHVYVPFCALLCFALPRQAAENGFVSPFFCRADIPGLITSDLAMISSLTWTKGGASNLWTKDGLPRAIDCTITITDLYPFLAMTKRMSFLSSNPSYTVFLDNMAGLCRVTNGIEDDAINEYFDKLIDRVNGVNDSMTSLWNKTSINKRFVNDKYGNTPRTSVTSGADKFSIPWLHNSSLY